jgi:L-lactate dehydrogenase complex protein LldE
VLNATDQIAAIATSAESQGTLVTYHETCHLRREIGATTQARAILEALPNVTLVEMPQSEVCCGFGGTFAVKYADISGAMLKDKVDNIKSSKAGAVVACDSSCLMHIGGGLDKQNVSAQPLHLAQLLDQAMG